MQKNKLIVLFIVFPFISQAAITKEQFMALADDKKWDLYVGHNACYKRIFKAKDDALIAHESAKDWWQTMAVFSTCVAISTTMLGVAATYYSVMNPRAPRV